MTTSLDLPLTRPRIALLACFAAATILLIPAHQHLIGAVFATAALVLLLRDPEPKLRRRVGVLLGCVVLLAICDINTSLSSENFLHVGLFFTAVIVLPGLIQRFGDRGVIRYRFLPERWRWHDVIYTILSIPLAWLVLKGYEWGNREWLNHELFEQWSMPAEADAGEIRRLFIGINLVGIWDELFFVNVCFALFRSLFRFPVANAMQAVIYTAVLFDMAFVGLGVFIVFAFAWTQGSMFEKSEGLLWVLVVHLIVDFFLVAMIVQHYYPDYGLDFLWRKGF